MRLRAALFAGVFLLFLTLSFSPLPGAQSNSTEGGGPSVDQLRQDPRVVEAIALFEIWAEAMVAYEQLPGMSVGVVYDQDLVWSRGFGYADVESRKPATPSTIYSICSISKLFTSIGVMQLRDQGKLGLDDLVADHIPWLDIQNTFPDGPPITVRSILSHSSGLPRENRSFLLERSRLPISTPGRDHRPDYSPADPLSGQYLLSVLEPGPDPGGGTHHPAFGSAL